ncbi:MAG: vitamin K epoxide reductase family protein [Parcubacteria group bacterium]|nr:vitamin K epoxide reductase family protein [Parcubacteria group bacterium]
MSIQKHTIGNFLLIVFALLGMAIMGYLISIHYASAEEAFCNLGEGLSCDVVNKSVYSEVFGVPVSVLGFLYFAGVFLLVLWKKSATPYQWLALVSIIFLGPSLYLTGIELFVLENICVFCEISKILIVAVIVTAFILSGREKPAVSAVVIAVFFGAALGLATYYAHTKVVPSGTYNTFAQCVYEKGMRMYGARTCVYCAKQRALFGDSVAYIKEIECDPREPNNETERCIAKKIERTPTWIREDAEGNTLKRFDPGVLSLQTLADETGCALPQKSK